MMSALLAVSSFHQHSAAGSVPGVSHLQNTVAMGEESTGKTAPLPLLTLFGDTDYAQICL